MPFLDLVLFFSPFLKNKSVKKHTLFHSSSLVTYCTTRPTTIMKPIYLLLLVLMACGFFACTTDYATDATEIAPQPEGKTLNASDFADFTSAMVELGFFDEESFTEPEDYGTEDVRILLDEEGEFNVDFLTNDGFDYDRTVEQTLAQRPGRNWSETITLFFNDNEADRLQSWLTDNFSGSEHVDLRVSMLVNGSIRISGLQPTKSDLDQFPAVSLF